MEDVTSGRPTSLNALEHQVVRRLPAGLGQLIPTPVDTDAHHVRSVIVAGPVLVTAREEPGADAIDVGGNAEVLEALDLGRAEAPGDGYLDVLAVALGQGLVLRRQVPVHP